MSIKPLTREQFSLALKLHRDRLNMTQAQAAELCGVSLRVWNDWEGIKRSTPLHATMVGVLEILSKAEVTTK